MSEEITNEIKKRRTFAIISHPDAGKTTLTEKFLLYGGAINTAGSVKGKANSKYAVSDWMEIEKERGISVTSSVLQFKYDDFCINILDTPGHQDFSEDTYRTLMAADSAVMVIDASKGVEAQTIKLFKVCVMRHIPIFTFINKMDREARDSFELLDDIESVLGIRTCPVNWPIGSGKRFKGIYDRRAKTVRTFESVSTGGAKSAAETDYDINDPALKDYPFTAEFADGKVVIQTGQELGFSGTKFYTLHFNGPNNGQGNYIWSQAGVVAWAAEPVFDENAGTIQLVFSDNGQGNGREARTLCFWENNDRYWSFTGQLCLTNALELSKNY